MSRPLLAERISEIESTPRSTRKTLAEMSDRQADRAVSTASTVMSEGGARSSGEFRGKIVVTNARLDEWRPRGFSSRVTVRPSRIDRRGKVVTIESRNAPPISFKGWTPSGIVEKASSVVFTLGNGGKITAADFYYPLRIGKLSTWVPRLFVLDAAMALVRSGGPAPGVDGIRPTDARPGLPRHLSQMLHNRGEIKPDPLRLVLIPKKNDKIRPLNIPTVRDRVFQTAINMVIFPVYEKKFLPCSFGFRPRRSNFHAIEQVLSVFESGYRWVCSLDIKDFSENLPHETIRVTLNRDLRDKKITEWIMSQCDNTSVLDAKTSRLILGLPDEAPLPGAWEGLLDGATIHRKKGMPQGGPVGPVIANAVLHRFDLWCASRGYRLVRYGDDITLLSKTRDGARQMLDHARGFLEGDLGLVVNEEKTNILDAHRDRVPVLGMDLFKGTIEPSAKNVETCKKEMERILAEGSTEDLAHAVECAWAWGGYFQKFAPPQMLADLEEWFDQAIRRFEPRAQNTPTTTTKDENERDATMSELLRTEVAPK